MRFVSSTKALTLTRHAGGLKSQPMRIDIHQGRLMHATQLTAKLWMASEGSSGSLTHVSNQAPGQPFDPTWFRFKATTSHTPWAKTLGRALDRRCQATS